MDERPDCPLSKMTIYTNNYISPKKFAIIHVYPSYTINPKVLDPPYKMDLDFGIILRRI